MSKKLKTFLTIGFLVIAVILIALYEVYSKIIASHIMQLIVICTVAIILCMGARCYHTVKTHEDKTKEIEEID